MSNEWRHDRGDDTQIECEIHGPGPRRVDEHPAQLLGDSLGGDSHDVAGHRSQRRLGSRLDLQVKPRSEPDGPENPQLVFAQPRLGLADGPEQMTLEILLTADIIE